MLGRVVNDLWRGRHTPDNLALPLSFISDFASFEGGSAFELEASLVESGCSLGDDVSGDETSLLFLDGKVGALRVGDLFVGYFSCQL